MFNIEGVLWDTFGLASVGHQGILAFAFSPRWR